MARTILAQHRATDIGDVQDGQTVKLVGVVVRPERPLQAPLSGHECVYYRCRLDTGSRTPAGVPTGRRVWECVDFTIETETGRRAFVETEEVLVITLDDLDDRVFVLPHPAIRRLLREPFPAPWARVDVHEGMIAIQERVAVVGRARWRVDDDAGGGSYRSRPTRLVLQAPAEHPLIISDDPSTF